MDRKEFLSRSGFGFLMLATGKIQAGALQNTSRFKAVLFDGFVIFNPAPVLELANSLYPDQGGVLVNTWKEKQFQYSWLRTSADEYVDFEAVILDALRFAAKKVGINLNEQSEKALLEQYLKLSIWPDVRPVIEELRNKGIKVGLLSNFTRKMMNAGLQNGNMINSFDYIISTDESRTFKPSKAVYQLGVKHTGFSKEEILFVAFAGWDASGASWYGYPVFWVNRAEATEEFLGTGLSGSSKDLNGLKAWIDKDK